MPSLPYDISPIPYFPWVPSFWSWLLIFMPAAAVLFARHKSKLKKKRSSLDPFSLAQYELSFLSASSGAKAELARLSLVLRRLLSAVAGIPADSLTPQELEIAAGKAGSAATAQIALLIKNLEVVLYGPLEPNALFVDSAVKQALDAIRELNNERKAGAPLRKEETTKED